ncbi:hypothetical protein [Endozoicomonas atrinae]|uniref:hypothetical protein n=1 Tax=Endozoicomonas atrinae TaxID=1333660 RepID=UPI003B00B29B
MYKNNFDMSSTGLNIELTCFYDCARAQYDFSESFTYIKQYKQHVFSHYGNVDVSNFEKTFKVNCTARELFIRYHQFANNSDPRYLRDLIRELNSYDDIQPIRHCTKEVMLNAIRNHCYDHQGYVEFMEKHFEPDYFELETRGYSQGDYARVIIPNEVLTTCGLDLTEANADSFQQEIDHLFWDAPLFFRVTIDGNEFDFVEYLGEYDYDKSKALDVADKHLLSDYPKPMQRYLRKFLEDNLPEQPTYS